VYVTRKTLGHAIDGTAEVAQFVFTASRKSDLKMAFGDLAGGARDVGDGTREAADERHPAEQRDEDHGKRAEQPGAVVEEERLGPEGWELPHEIGANGMMSGFLPERNVRGHPIHLRMLHMGEQEGRAGARLRSEVAPF
jgi:hypothetical protein